MHAKENRNLSVYTMNKQKPTNAEGKKKKIIVAEIEGCKGKRGSIRQNKLESRVNSVYRNQIWGNPKGNIQRE